MRRGVFLVWHKHREARGCVRAPIRVKSLLKCGTQRKKMSCVDSMPVLCNIVWHELVTERYKHGTTLQKKKVA